MMKPKATAAVEQRIRIVVLEDLELFRKGICLLLSQQNNYEVVGDTGTWDALLPMIQRDQPDVVIFGLDSDNNGGTDRIADILAASETVKVLILSNSKEPEFHRKLVRLGAAGVVCKDKSTEMLVKAVRCVNEGEAWLDRFSTASLLRELSPRNRPVNQDPEERKIASLTDREREVIELIGKGFKNKQIAEALFISDVTVHHHLTSIYAKLDVADRFELLIFAYRNHLADLPR
jgi:two-component system nitrate/nitrite response regulator NarL